MDLSAIRTINPQHPQPELILEAADVIQRGGMAVFPTRCLYGLGADAFNLQAVNRVFDLKQRSAQHPILVLIDDHMVLERLAKRIPVIARELMEQFWPGRITIVFEAKDTVPDNLTAGSGKIGVRMPGHAVALDLAKAVQGPITGTSANISGEAGCAQIEHLDAQFARQVDLILDAGALQGGLGSTIVDVTDERLQIIREGEISTEEIQSVLE